MKTPMKMVGISGSLRKNSYNTLLLDAIKNLVPDHIDMTIYTLNDIPMFSEDLETGEIPEVVKKLADDVKSSDALVIATPEYNGTISGALGNTLDWLSRKSLSEPLKDKPLGVVGASTGQSGTIRAQKHLKSLGITLSMYPFNRPAVRVAHAQEKFDEEGNLTDTEVKQSVSEFLDFLYEFTLKLNS